MPKTASPFPAYLADRYRAWRALRFAPDRAWYARLAEDGQHPRAMVISCCDSRVDAATLFSAEPGDLFAVRNVAALVPPFTDDGALHGVTAAIEFAVTSLHIAHIIILGHSNCGGVAACRDMCAGRAPHLEQPGSFVGRWMSILTPGYEAVAKRAADPAEEQRLLEHEAVLTSLRNLETFDFVRDAVARRVLTLHGAWVDIGDGRLHLFNPETRLFSPIETARA
jgi:carbonic anhydrase